MDAALTDLMMALFIAPFIGSFLGCVIERLPRGQPVVFARSACGACGHRLGWGSLLPVLSYCRSRGRCRYCRLKIPPFHLAIEIAATVVVLPVGFIAGSDPSLLWTGCALSWLLLALAWIDWLHLFLPDTLTVILLLSGFTSTWITDPGALPDHIVASVIGYLVMRWIALLYERLRGKSGLGAGDAKLLGAGGAWVGTYYLAPTVLIGSSSALLFFAIFKWVRRQPINVSMPIPFGPWLSFGLWLCWLDEQSLMPWW